MIIFNRKSKNRRMGRTHVLDVKLRSDQVRASRVRLTAIALALVFGTVLGFYLVWRAGEFALNRFIYENKQFAVQDIQVETDGVIAPEQLRRWAGVTPGENLLALDLSRVKRDLEMVSMIRSVAVERVLPHTLRLRVAEREPLAQIRVLQMRPSGGLEMGVLHLDGEGYVMALVGPEQRATPLIPTNQTLPAISGINQGDLVPGKKVDSPQARAALQLINAFEHSQMSGLVEIETIDISLPEVLQAKTTQGSVITFSLRDLDYQLRCWCVAREYGLRIGKVIATLDLSVPKNSPSTWMEASLAPVASPRNPNLQRTRKKNV